MPATEPILTTLRKLIPVVAPLTNSPLGRKLSCGLTIHKDGENRGGNAGMDQADEGSREIHYVKRSNDEVLADAIEGLGKIYLKKETLIVPTPKIERMDDFLSDDNVRRDVHILNKSRLGIVNEP